VTARDGDQRPAKQRAVPIPCDSPATAHLSASGCGLLPGPVDLGHVRGIERRLESDDLELVGARRDRRAYLVLASEDRRMVEFERDWLMSSLKAIKPRFEAILQPTMTVARRYPDLAETVRAYSRCRYSVSACARELHIHPNSARYRLDRWKALTGHDIETAYGLIASVIALELMS
jgi:DNA-binding PucR family transcriptional regulator